MIAQTNTYCQVVILWLSPTLFDLCSSYARVRFLISCPLVAPTFRQVKTWGILWRPLGVPLRHSQRVLHAIVRLHNFVRRERDDAPVTVGQLGMNTNGSLTDEAWYPPASGGAGAAATSTSRNMVVADILRRGLQRPAHKVTRNNTESD